MHGGGTAYDGVKNALRNLVAVAVEDGRIAHQVADMADEHERTTVQRQLAATRLGINTIRIELAGEGLAVLGDFFGQRALHEAEPVAIDVDLVFGVDCGDRIFAIHDGGQRRLDKHVVDTGGIGPADGGLAVDLDFQVQAMTAQQDRVRRSHRASQWFGGGLGIAPHADIQDGNLAFVILGDVTLFDYLKYLPKVKRKEFIDHPSLFYYSGKSCEIEVLEGENLIELDGEFLGPAPAKLNIHPKAISLIGMLAFFLFFIPSLLLSQKADLFLQKQMEKAVAGFKGDVGIYVYDMKKDKVVNIHADTVFPTASIVKVPILLGVMDKIKKGDLSYHQKLIYKDSLLYEGEDILGSFKDGESIELSKVMMLMLTTSDNTASLWLQSLAGTGLSINALMDQLGFIHTRVNSRTPGREINRDKYGWGQSTPKELVQLFQQMLKGNLLGKSSDDLMIKRLGRNYWDEEALAEIPAGIFTASKNGAVNASRSEVVYVNHPKNPYIFCIMTANNTDKSWESDNEAWVLTRNLSKLLWQYFND